MVFWPWWGVVRWLVAVLTAGQTLGGFARDAALLLPGAAEVMDGPNDFQVNRTAASARITPEATVTGDSR